MKLTIKYQEKDYEFQYGNSSTQWINPKKNDEWIEKCKYLTDCVYFGNNLGKGNLTEKQLKSSVFYFYMPDEIYERTRSFEHEDEDHSFDIIYSDELKNFIENKYK
jgi:hypothetical protein